MARSSTFDRLCETGFMIRLNIPALRRRPLAAGTGIAKMVVRRHVGEILVLLYLVAILAANLLIAAVGQKGLVITAFLLIPFDLVTRDVLHQRWQGNRLVARLALLVASGSALTLAVSPGAGRVALASCLAFGAAAVADSFVFQLLIARPRLVRVNGSNAVSALLDSSIFPLVAFGLTGVSLSLCLAQAASKFAGGLVWSILLSPLFRRRTAA